MKKLQLIFSFILLPLDILMVLLAFVAAFYLRERLEITPLVGDFGLRDYMKLAIYLIPAWVLFFSTNNLYSVKRQLSGVLAEFYRIFIASSTSILILIVVIFLTHSLFFSRIILVFTWLCAILFVFAGRLIWRAIQDRMFRKGIGLRNILAVGNSAGIEAIAREISQKYGLGYKLIGIVTDSEESKSELKYLGKMSELNAIVKKYKIDDVILSESSMPKRKIAEILEICDENSVTLKYLPDIYSLMTYNFYPSLIGTIPVMEAKTMPLDGWGRIIKRLIDIIFSLLAIVILSPILLLIALLIKLTSKGPVLFIHRRVGRDEKEFKFYKFRSMYCDKCDWGETGVWTTANDEKTRITAFGKFIRKTNLDELPQLFNILKGDMSFVGPRPELPKLVEKFEGEIPEYFRRHRVKTGLTGWAQVNGLKGDSSIEDRVKYDIYYIENWSLWFDLKIIIKTVGMVLYEVFNGKFEYSTGPRVDN
jgi:exopolysaccharide biosynthesis polyprenyl glycosylphosphotransferase